MKIAEYNDMMSYLTRPGFSGGSDKKPTTIEELKKSGKIVTGDKYKPSNPKLIQAIRDFEIRHGFRKKNDAGGPQIVEPSKSMQMDTTTSNPIPEYDINDFKNDAEIFVLASHNNTLPRADIVDKLNSLAQKGVDAGTFTMQDAGDMVRRLMGEVKDRAQKQRLRDVIIEGTGTVERENKAIGGGVIKGQELPNNREGFAYSIKQVNEKRIKASQAAGEGIDISSLTPEQKKLYDEGKLFYTRVKESADSDKYKNIFGTEKNLNFITGKIDMKDLPDDLSNLPPEVKNTGKLAQLIKKKFISDYLATLPEGSTILLDNTARVINEKLMEATNGRIRLPDKSQLQKVLDDKKLNTNNIKAPKNLKEAKSLMFADEYPEKKELPKFEKVAEKLNKKYKLKNKGINFAANTSAKTGRVYLELRFSSPAVREEFNKVPRITAAPTKEGIEKLTNELDDVINTDFFKNYDSREGMKLGMTTEQALKKVKYNQAELFEYLLNKEGPISEKEVMDKIGYNKGTLRKAVGNLHENIYRALDANQPGSGRFLSDQYNPDQIKSVLDKVKNNFNVDYYRRTFEKLLIDAYGDDIKKYKPLINKLEKFRDLQKELQKAGVGEEFIAQLDHVIPYNFLQLIRKGSNPEDLIRVRAYPGVLNNNLFKGTLDRKLNKGREIFEKTGDRKLLDTMNELRSFLPQDMGKVSSTGKKVIDYGAEPFNLKTLYSEQQKKFGEVYDRTQKFLENPRVIELLKDAGITFRGIGQLRKLNVPGFLNTFDKILERRPDLRVELGDEFSDIENQYASLNMEGDFRDFVAREEEKKKDPLPYEAALPAGVAAGKYGPQVLNLLKNVGKAAIKPVIAPAGAVTFAASELASDDPSQALAGLELLYPEVIRQVKGKISPVKNIYDKALALSPSLRYAPYVTKGMSGLGTLMIGSDIIQGLDKRIGLEQRGPLTEQELLDMRERETYMGNIADAFDKAYREGTALPGRTNFADGPEDPSKRKFMKIMGGLASLPIVGRFFKIGEKAAPVIDAVKTEVAKGKPEWFDALVNKVIREGTDMTKQFATKEREIVHATKISDDEYVRVTQDLETGSVRVEYENPDNMGGEAVNLVYKKELPDEGNPNPAPNFYATELEPRGIRTGPDDYDIEFDGENYAENVDELMSDTTTLKEFATGEKRTMKEIVESKKKKDKTKAMNESTMEQAEYLESKYGPGDDLYYQDFSDYD